MAARNGSRGDKWSSVMWHSKTRPTIDRRLMSKLNRRVNVLITSLPKQNEQCSARKECRAEVSSYAERAGRYPGRDISALGAASGAS